MSFDSQLRHRLVIERPTATTYDDYNHPIPVYADLATVHALVQPKSASEVARVSQAGAVVSDHTVFLRPTDLTTADRLREAAYAVDDEAAVRYEIQAINDAGGQGRHLELETRLVTAPELDPGEGS